MTSIFDLDCALDRVDGDRELLQELAGIYLDEAARLRLAISQAMDKHDICAAAKVAHTLKGASANFCSQPVYDAAWQLEQMLPSNTAEEVATAYDKLVQETERLSQALRQEFEI